MWLDRLHHDPIPPLLKAGGAVAHLARRDLLGEDIPSGYLQRLPESERLLQKQLPDGTWKYPGKRSVDHPRHYPLLETWKQFRYLVECYEFMKEHESARRAAEALFSFQTEEGDIRGMLGNQYATYYTGAILSLLIKAGYEDERVERGIRWLLSMRQDDGGWSVPIITVKLSGEEKTRAILKGEPIMPDRSKPFSHNATGMVLRAFAAHSRWRKSREARMAGGLLLSRFFNPDECSFHRAPAYWVRFGYPFWWNDLLSALDTLSRLGFDEEDVHEGLDWIVDNQMESGLWKTTYMREETNPKLADARRPWISLQMCRMMKAYCG